jgi:Selenophosphate synthase
VLRGAAEVAAEAGCFVAGGHTIDDPVPKYGLAVTGLADPARLMTIDRAAPGDQLI